MTTGPGNTGQSGQSGMDGRGGPASSHISAAIPAALVVLVLAIMVLAGWYIVRRLRLTGRSLLSLLAGSPHRPELSDIELIEPTLQRTHWDAISPVAVEFVCPDGREHWQRERQQSPGRSSSSVAMHSDSGDRLARYVRGHTAFESERRHADLSDPEDGGLRVAVLVAMPSPPRGPHRAGTSIDSGISPELCLGTVLTSIRR